MSKAIRSHSVKCGQGYNLYILYLSIFKVFVDVWTGLYKYLIFKEKIFVVVVYFYTDKLHLCSKA